MHECKVLPEKISNLITPLRNLIRQLSIYNKLPQIEFASNQERDILIFRILEELNESDIVLLKSFQEKNEIEVWTQSKGPETVKPLFENINPKVSYILRKRNLEISFNPSGFIQINPFINELMIEKALDLLEPKNKDIIIDFFSGLGNFTLPIAQNAKNVIGIEGSEVLVELGKLNAKNNNLKNVVFTFADLFKIDENFYESIKHANKWLLDPPRDGAMALIQGMPDHIRPKRIIYVSCNAATLARDANILTSKGYNYQSAGILNMFPNTSHIESISMFELNE
jgi:23S rRNA (uracil1939-C5)-methyltransferase